MNKLLALVLVGCVVVLLAGGLAGCASSNSTECAQSPVCPFSCCTMVLDPAAHSRQVARYQDLERRQVCEDWDYLWLQDEPSHLTSWFMPSKPR